MKKPSLRILQLVFGIMAILCVCFWLFGACLETWTQQVIQASGQHPWTTGLILAMLLASDILLPVPSSMISVACGLSLGLVGGTCASFAGMMLSAIIGYFMGRAASGPACRMIGLDEADQMKRFYARFGVWIILIVRPVPMLSETAMLVSGLARQPFLRVMTAAGVGNLLVSAGYAAMGAYGQRSNAFVPAFVVAMALSGGLMFFLRPARKETQRNTSCPVGRDSRKRFLI